MQTDTGIIEISRLVALLSFLFGSLILLFFCLSENSLFLIIGLIYLIAALLINVNFLIGLIVKYPESDEKKRIKLSILLMLLNIPIAYSYFLIAMDIFSSITD
ncbi:hypothetical protein [Olleya sp. YS]|uniref:hypothetical protein n=1 Tax=Olleya sp. YS TaxID=3028318 RepID=UPI0024342688|nr:hypothetical protein [Olleya sp. YS]WGD35300.1 hypothetical protein Ollyesu_02560 [Olleya sp. YS]